MKKKLRSRKQIGTQIKNNKLVEEKRLQIAAGATKLFIKKGYASTSIREISKTAGITIGSLYDYITKKDDILYLVFDLFHSMWVNRLEQEGVFEIKDSAEQLRFALRKMLQLVNAQRDMVLLMNTEAKLLPKDCLRMILKNESDLVKCFEKILEKGIANGTFKTRNPFLYANIIVYLLSLEPLRGWNFRKHYNNQYVNKFLIEFIMNGVLSVPYIVDQRRNLKLLKRSEEN